MSTQDVAVERELRRIDEATQWLQALRDGAMDESTITRWLTWSADAQNLQEFEQLRAVWDGVGTLERRAQLSVEPVRGVRPRAFRTALAAGVMLGLGTGAWYIWDLATSPVNSYSTAVAATTHIPLADGSRVQLAPLSKVSTRFTADARIVNVESGEAYFEVAKDPARPFIVNTGEFTVTALGTAFNVHKTKESVRVAVTEGSIGVAVPGERAPEPIEARAGQQVEYSFAERRLTVGSADPQVATAWRSGVLKFIDEPLRDVVADLNRYSKRKIVIDDASLSTLPYTGTVFADRIDQWLLAAQDAFPLYIEEEGKDRVRLKAK